MLLGFKKRFKDPILIGTKVFTMRDIHRKNKPKIGETLHMYTGLKTKNCEKITDKEKLHGFQTAHLIIEKGPKENNLKIQVEGRDLSQAEIEQFVGFDGFKDTDDFINYWIESSTGKKPKADKQYVVSGFLTIYHWTDLRF